MPSGVVADIDPSIVAAVIGGFFAVLLVLLGAILTRISRRRVVVRKFRIRDASVDYYIINRGTATHYIGASYVTIRVVRRAFWKLLLHREPIRGAVLHRAIPPNGSLNDAFSLSMMARRHNIYGRWVLIRARVRLEAGHTSRSRLRLCRLPQLAGVLGEAVGNPPD
jgi:hypothetical protein